ncbi:MAG: GNAT family N-acetyltransferase [Ktedonobacteraceae bacterium]|jgi:ribosomal protein S18 acetylase RimI-like enzyme
MMIDELPTTPLVIRLATPDDISLINVLDSYSDSPTRDIHREIEKYFGSVDPSTHEKTLIFLAEVEGVGAAKAELMLPPAEAVKAIGYIKRVVVDPQYRKRGLAHQLMLHIITFARTELHVEAIDLHVWENNFSAIRLYEALGFELQHRELYYRLPL